MTLRSGTRTDRNIIRTYCLYIMVLRMEQCLVLEEERERESECERECVCERVCVCVKESESVCV